MPTSLIGGLIGGIGSIIGGNTAAQAQQAAAAQAAAQRTANQNLSQPYINAGNSALTDYGNSLGINGAAAQQNYYNNFLTDPAYQGQLNAGVNAVSNSYLARGVGYGGNAMKAVNDYGANLLNNAYNTRSNQLAGLANLGSSSVNALNTANSGLATSGSNATANAGLYQGNSIIGAANSLMGAFKGNQNLNANNAGQAAAASGYNPSWSNTSTVNNWSNAAF